MRASESEAQRVRVLDVEDLPVGTQRTAEAFGTDVALFNVGGEIFAVAGSCPHAGGPLCHGRIGGAPLPSTPYEYVWGRDDRVLTCPWHGWQFDLETGSSLFDPLVTVAKYEVEVRDGGIWLREA